MGASDQQKAFPNNKQVALTSSDRAQYTDPRMSLAPLGFLFLDRDEMHFHDEMLFAMRCILQCNKVDYIFLDQCLSDFFSRRRNTNIAGLHGDTY